MEYFKMSIDDKLSTVKYTSDIHSHLNPDCKECLKCSSKCCTIVCPANVYAWDEDNKKLIVNYENCLECGACRIACERKCLKWEYPRGTKGVTFKQG